MGKKSDMWVCVTNTKQKPSGTSTSKCYNPNCNNTVALNKDGHKLSACKKHLHEYYTKCTICIHNDRAKDTKTQRLLLFCTECYQNNYLKKYSSTGTKDEPKICDRCKEEVCSTDHRICLKCRRVWRSMCVICRRNTRLTNNQYHCKQCHEMYQKNGCHAKIWINDKVGRKQCWSIAPDRKMYCQRCQDYGLCSENDCHNLSSQEYCLECQTERKEIINEINIDRIKVINRKGCTICKEIDRLPGELHCGRWGCIN